MHSLSDFPTEILLKIIPYNSPDGIEELVLCSKRMYEIAKMGPLKQHYFEKRMRDFVWPADDKGQGRSDWLRQNQSAIHRVPLPLISQQRLASCVKRLSIDKSVNSVSHSRWEETVLSLGREVDQKSTLWKFFFDTVNRNLVPFENNTRTYWKERLEHGGEMTIMCMLLVKFQNLEIVRVHDRIDRNLLVPFLHIVAVANQSRAKDGMEPVALGKMTELSMKFDDYRIERGIIEGFAKMPSMRRIHISDSDETLKRWSSRGTRSNVREVRIGNFRVSTTELEAVLRYLKNLETFVYLEASRWRTDEDHARNLVEVLKNYAQDSLEEIILRSSDLPFESYNYGMDSLSEFNNLRRIGVDAEMFIRPPVSTVTHYIVTNPADQLPASIEVLTIFCKYNLLGMPGKSGGFLANITALKNVQVPHLRRIIFVLDFDHVEGQSRDRKLYPKLAALCERVGITVTIQEWGS